ncbi:MAG: nucleoside deaminase [Chitinophagaceae bacterium]|nr:nucleoside deaminase [Chitinophagaceae bacterium]
MFSHPDDHRFMKRAIELALAAEQKGNLPIGAVITLNNEIIAEGYNSIFVPVYNPGLHAEMTALDRIPEGLWKSSGEMTCYTTLEPCCMCFGRLLLSGTGRIVFGSIDPEGGAGCLISHLPKFFSKENIPQWEGPVMPGECDALFQRAWAMFCNK